jgi:acyl dehydratase
MTKTYLEDYALGERFISPARTITDADLVGFAALTGDWSEVHTNAVVAAEGPFERPILHGMATMSIGNALIHRLGPSVYFPKSFIAFYGMESVRFTAPVFVGDTLRCELEVVELTDKSPSRGLLVYSTELKKHPDVVVAAYRQSLLVGRKGGQA